MRFAGFLALLLFVCGASGCRRLSASDPEPLSPSYRQFPASGRVFLTFDAHPCGSTLRNRCDEPAAIAGAWQLLDTLRAEGVHSTFFFTGEFIERYPDIARRVLADGHEIGSHLKTHTHPMELQSQGRPFSREWFLEELLSADRALVAATGSHAVKLFRMPYGLSTYTFIPGVRRILAWSHEAGYAHVDWTVDTFDWVSRAQARDSFLLNYVTADQMEERILSMSRKGPVVLSHLTRYRPGTEPSVNEALPALLARLRVQNISPALVSQFLPEPGSSASEEAVVQAVAPGGTSVAAEGARQCNYVWNFKRLHVCIEGMRDDCATLESPFLQQEESCACTRNNVEYNLTNLGELVQITCSIR